MYTSAECPGGHCTLVQNVRGDIPHGGTIHPPTPALVGAITIAMILACSISFPISLLVRPTVRKSLWYDVDEEEEELISKFSKVQTASKALHS